MISLIPPLYFYLVQTDFLITALSEDYGTYCV